MSIKPQIRPKFDFSENAQFTDLEKQALIAEWQDLVRTIDRSVFDLLQFSPSSLLYCFIQQLETRGFDYKYKNPADYVIISYSAGA